MKDIGVPLLLGLAFGVCLHRAGLTRYARIVGIYRLRDWTVMRFLLTALVVGAFVVQVARDLGIAQPVAVPPTNLGADAIGGAIFGVGMALSGFCPGTIVAGAGEGRLDAAIFGVLGLLVGAVGFGTIAPRLVPWFGRLGPLGRATIPEWLDASPWLVLLLLAELTALGLYLTADRARARLQPVQTPAQTVRHSTRPHAESQ